MASTTSDLVALLHRLARRPPSPRSPCRAWAPPGRPRRAAARPRALPLLLQPVDGAPPEQVDASAVAHAVEGLARASPSRHDERAGRRPPRRRRRDRRAVDDDLHAVRPRARRPRARRRRSADGASRPPIRQAPSDAQGSGAWRRRPAPVARRRLLQRRRRGRGHAPPAADTQAAVALAEVLVEEAGVQLARAERGMVHDGAAGAPGSSPRPARPSRASAAAMRSIDSARSRPQVTSLASSGS